MNQNLNQNQNIHAASNKRKKKFAGVRAKRIQRNNLLDAIRFAMLMNRSHENENERIDDEQQSGTAQSATVKPSPITVTGKSANECKTIVSACDITAYTMEVISIGTKIHLETISDSDKLISELSTKNIEFFTHRLKNAKPFKAVIYGLPKTDLDELKATLASLNLEALEVFEMKTKNEDPNNRLYLVHFKRDNVSLDTLRNIKALGNVVIRWAAYSPRFKGPTQCRKCTMYGHGASNCNRKMVCAYCAQSTHEAKDCTITRQ